jgi:cell fate regulator YaaT (PSP1 superfamily)
VANTVKVKLKESLPLKGFELGEDELKPDDKVVVSWQQGLALGTVVSFPMTMPHCPSFKPDGVIVRLASSEDLAKHENSRVSERSAFSFCLERARVHNLPLKLIDVDFLLDDSKAIFYFTAEGRIDFRGLVKDLARQFRTRIEMRQIGVRDETKMLGGLGYCGRALCCSTFLKEFSPVSIKAAKDQSLTLNLEKISGLCGRLMCCLTFEQPVYQQMKSCLPKCGKRVCTGKGTGKVVKLKVLEGTAVIKLPDGQLIECKPEEME